VNSRVGLPFITGPLGNPDVVNHVLPAWDLITGQTIALGLLAAERQRRRSGAGQHIKLALEDVALAVMGHLGYIAEAQLGQERARIGNHLFGAFGRDFRTADGERVMVVGLTGKQWRSLCDATESVEQMALLGQRLDLDLDQEGNRFRARNEISEVVAAWIGARPFADVAAQFDRHGVCWGRYQSVTQLVQRDPSCSVANPMFARVEQPGVGTLLMPSTPLDFSAAPRVAPRPAPRLGEHTEQVLHELLGIDAAAFGRLHDRGVVAARAEPA
jgi:2-methylfumaryl-CoA isomerase